MTLIIGDIFQVFLEMLGPMIDSLTDAKLLGRCLRGATQNANESINSVVWSILSKDKNHGYRSIRGAAALAVLFFNRGRSGLIRFFDKFDLPVTEESINAIVGKDLRRIDKAQAMEQSRARIKERKQQKRFEESMAKDEEMDYSAGMF